MRTVGKIRKKLSTMLAKHGIMIDPHSLHCQEGPVYRNSGNDLARWSGFAQYNGRQCFIYSWDTMTDCVQKGFTLSPDKDWHHVEISHIEEPVRTMPRACRSFT